MENDNLNRLFRDNLDDLNSTENLDAILDIRVAARELAGDLNRYLPESASKNDLLGRLFRIVVDSELAIRMDGVSRTISPIVMTRQ